jgi:hypothetical protein
MKKALLIGINYSSIPSVRLNGCINDIVNIKNVLIDAYDYDPANITMLRDDINVNSMRPTRDNLISNLRNIVAQSNTLSEIWIHYSGHGSQIRDLNGDEGNGGQDSILVPSDYQTKGFITDDDILAIIRNIKCRAILVFDCCHSGTICDLPWSFEYNSPLSYSRKKNNNIVISNPNIFMFSGCRDTQSSFDTYSNESTLSVGAFTNAFITCLRNNRHNVQFLNLFRDVCIVLTNGGYAQNPTFSSSNANPNLFIVRSLTASVTSGLKNITVPNNVVIKSVMKSLIYG